MSPVHIRREAAGWMLRPLMLLVLLVLLSAARAGAQESLSPAIGDPLSDSVYQETDQNGTLGSLPGGGNLTSPNTRTGINDPLGFLLETGTMSPYTSGTSVVNSYANASPFNGTLTDPFVALQTGEYRNNHAFMAGAGGRSQGGGRTSAAGGTISSAAGVRNAQQQAMLHGAGAGSFAAGSSASLSAANGGATADLGSGALFSSGTVPAAGLEGSTVQSAGASPSGMGSVEGVAASGVDSLGQTFAGVPATGIVRLGADTMPLGPGPGDIFPSLSVVTPSSTGFEDSTMGIAGLVAPRETGGLSPLLSGRLNADAASPFPEMSSQTTSFLRPSLHAAGGAGGAPRSTMTLREFTREARLHALVSNPDAIMPSPFEERAMQRAYVRQRQEGRGRSRAGTVPTIVPNP